MDLVKRLAQPITASGARQEGLAVAAACSRVALAALLGCAWTAAPAYAVYAPVLLVLWWRATSRWEAAALGAAYQLGATHGLAAGAAAYLGIRAPMGIAAMMILALAVAIPWGVCWVPQGRAGLGVRGLVFAAWFALTLLPMAFGAALVAHPLMAAGWWFPGCGWWGLALTAAGLFLTCTDVGAANVVCLSSLSVLLGWSDPAASVDNDVEGVDTQAAPALGELDFAGQYRVAEESLAASHFSTARVVVLPEGSAGSWTEPMRRLWQRDVEQLRAQGRFVVVGASTKDSAGILSNSAVVLGGPNEVIVPQRVPIPVAMWRPWGGTGFAAHPWAAGVTQIDGRSVGIVVCWEGALVLPALLSLANGAEVLVHLANHAWVGDAGLPTVVATKSWGALFGVPVVIARNAQGGDDA